MAKHTINHACGHTSKTQLFGPIAKRQWTIDNESKKDCFECYKQAQLEYAQAKSAELDLPKLTGTPKQVAWAMSIRQQAFVKFGKCINMELVRKHTEARFWIDARNDIDYFRASASSVNEPLFNARHKKDGRDEQQAHEDRYEKAKAIFDEMVRQGQSTDQMKSRLKKVRATAKKLQDTHNRHHVMNVASQVEIMIRSYERTLA